MEVKRSYRPLIAVIFTFAMAVVVSFFFYQRAVSVVRAPCFIYPREYAAVQSPRAGGRVTKVYKKWGDTVKQGEPLVQLDTEDLDLQRKVIAKKIEGLNSQVKEFEHTISMRKAQADQARQAEKYAAALVGIEKAALKAAQVQLERAGPGPAAIEINNATMRFENAKAVLENAKAVLQTSKGREKLALEQYEMYKALQKDGSATVEQVRTMQIAWEAAKGAVETAQGAIETANGAVRDREGELKLLKEVEIPIRLATAQAEVDRRTESIKGFEADVLQKRAAVGVAEANVLVDEVTFKLKTEIAALEAEDKQVEYQITDKIVVAPLSGYLDQFKVQVGHWINYREALGMVYDTSSKVVWAHVQQKDFSKIAVGNRAKILLEGASEFYGNKGIGPVNAEVISCEPIATPPPLDNVIEPIAFLTEPMKGTWTPRALVKLKLIDAPESKIHMGFSGSVKILVDDQNQVGKLFFK